MFITSISDPEIFNPANVDSDASYAGTLSAHIDRLFFYHIPIFDNTLGNSIMGQRIVNFIPEIVKKVKANGIQERINAVISPSRIIRLKPDDARLEKIKELVDNDSSAIAVALAGYTHDILVVNPDTFSAMELGEIPLDKTVPIHDYYSSQSAEIERKYQDAYQLSGMPTSEFINEILTPTLFWAKSVKIIDKMINPAAFPRESGNWDSFKKTIIKIYDEWASGHGYNAGIKETFEIISIHTNNHVGDLEAEKLAEKLDLPKTGHVKISLKPPSDSVLKENFHDRYIQTNQFTVGFSKGFDISRDDGTCSTSFVCRYPTGDTTLNNIVSSRNTGTFIW